ncbi:hypothetical protein [uncultured Methanolobus sp.]|uniref:hypothetical protein n=1 Tax=uncultured Methanolobus sp. TaxID=218300 RepID=UPI003747BC92
MMISRLCDKLHLKINVVNKSFSHGEQLIPKALEHEEEGKIKEQNTRTWQFYTRVITTKIRIKIYTKI